MGVGLRIPPLVSLIRLIAGFRRSFFKGAHGIFGSELIGFDA